MKERCKICKEVFKSSLKLKAHLLKVHDIVNLKCHICKAIIKKSMDFETHYFKIHSLIDEKYKCCGLNKNKFDHKKHQILKHNAKFCYSCEKTFPLSYNNNDHFCKKEVKSYICKYCKNMKNPKSAYFYTDVDKFAKHIFKYHFGEKNNIDNNLEDVNTYIRNCETNLKIKDEQEIISDISENIVIKDRYFYEMYLYAKTHNNNYNFKNSKDYVNKTLNLENFPIGLIKKKIKK